MSHSHAHHGSCNHHHHPVGSNVGRLGLVLVLTALYMVVEFLGGVWSHSLALIADASHMMTDVGALALALFAAWFAEHPASEKKTYGYYRLEILAAFINGIALAVISLYIFYEAWQRFQHPEPVEGTSLMWIASGGLAINLLSAWILFTPGQKNVNMHGAYLHVLSDSIGSVGVILAGAMVIFFGWTWADPVLSVLIALLVLGNAWRLIMETANVLLEGCPVHLNVSDIERALTDLHEIQAVHDLHVWSITTGKEALSVHVVVEDHEHYKPELVTKIQQVLKEKFGLTHLTIQLETPDFEEDEIHF